MILTLHCEPGECGVEFFAKVFWEGGETTCFPLDVHIESLFFDGFLALSHTRGSESSKHKIRAI